MGAQEFIDGLAALGHKVEVLGGGKVAFPYLVESGKFAGQEIRLGFVVPGDFSASPPSGPHVSPRLLPITGGGGDHPSGGVHASNEFGPDWEYWSRPLKHWPQTARTVRDVMAHIRHLFDTQ